MPPNRDPTQAAEWLRRACSNLARARADRSVPEALYEDLCFDAQQAAEKAIKAVRGITARGQSRSRTSRSAWST